jgi:hypothetical protein
MWNRRPSLLLAVSLLLAAVCLAQVPVPGSQGNEPNLTEEQQREFLLTAKVVGSNQSTKGITHGWKLTLSDGKLTHYAYLETVDEHEASRKFDDGHTELNFVDTYHYDIAGYELAKLVGMSDMVPVYVARQWNDKKGALTWWINWKWDEGMRIKQNLPPPDADAWDKQMYKIRVFDQLVYDTDPNLTNILITEDWKLWRIDFSRAFRLYHDLQSPKDLVKCDRQLLEKLRKLDGGEVLEKTKPHLSKPEVNAVMARRDKIVAHFQQLIAQKGESAVLY